MTNIPQNNNVSPENISSIKAKKSKREKLLLTFKIIGTLTYVVMTAILIRVFIDALPSNEPQPDNTINLDGLGFVFVVIIFAIVGFFVYLVPTILGIVGAIVSKKMPAEERTAERTFNLVYFTVMSVLPMATDILFFCTLFFVEGN